MKKLFTLITILGISLLFIIDNTHAYTLTTSQYYYNQVTNTIGESDVLDIGTTYYERLYFNLGMNDLSTGTTRVVFSNTITTEPLPTTGTSLIKIIISFYDASNNLIYSDSSRYYASTTFSYYENNFDRTISVPLDYITIRFENLTIGYDEDIMHLIAQNAIIGAGNTTIINQTIGTTQYQNGWTDAMASKVEQIWSLWDNIFNTFMGVFSIFSIQLVGDITIGHIALVPLVLGLIGFIYALGGKRGR